MTAITRPLRGLTRTTPSKRRSFDPPITQSEPKARTNCVGSTGRRSSRRIRPLSGSTAMSEPPASVAPVRGSCRPATAIHSVRSAAKICVGGRGSATRNAIAGLAGMRQEMLAVSASRPPVAEAPPRAALAVATTMASRKRRVLTRLATDWCSHYTRAMRAVPGGWYRCLARDGVRTNLEPSQPT